MIFISEAHLCPATRGPAHDWDAQAWLRFYIALWVEGSVEERSDAVAGFVQEAWENPRQRLPPSSARLQRLGVATSSEP